MIHYHGGLITPDTCAIRTWRSRHAFISYSRTDQLGLATEICQSFGLDNGAFTFWKTGEPIDWAGYYEFVARWKNHPRFDFAIIPDVIDGSAEANDKLISEWPHGDYIGVPVWHMNEPEERFIELCNAFPRVAIGSCGEYDVRNPSKCVIRLRDVIRHVVDGHGQPIAKLHGLRMLNPLVFKHLPLSSADSSNVARNIGIDSKWSGAYSPQSRETRASILAERIESTNSASALHWNEQTERVDIQLSFNI